MGCHANGTGLIRRDRRTAGNNVLRNQGLPGKEAEKMMRIVVDIYDGEDPQGTKEAVAMLLEPLGRVRVVSVITNGKEEKR
nr:MAG TPA: hypothetical protein [Caudoviricetes sp.]